MRSMTAALVHDLQEITFPSSLLPDLIVEKRAVWHHVSSKAKPYKEDKLFDDILAMPTSCLLAFLTFFLILLWLLTCSYTSSCMSFKTSSRNASNSTPQLHSSMPLRKMKKYQDLSDLSKNGNLSLFVIWKMLWLMKMKLRRHLLCWISSLHFCRTGGLALLY